MFEQSMVIRNAGTRRPFAMLMSLAAQCLFLAMALTVPLVFTDMLPAAQLSTLFVLPPLPVAAHAARPVEELPKGARRVNVKPVATNQFTAPSRIPKDIPILVEEIEIDPALAQLASNLPSGPGGSGPAGPGVLGLERFVAGPPQNVPPPPPPVKEKKKEVIRIRQGGDVVEARAISKPSPVYPAMARQVRVQGDVRLNAIIGTDGRIKELQVQSGHPFLVKAAVDAVSQWRYSPTILNGDPVEVITQITVSFKLQ